MDPLARRLRERLEALPVPTRERLAAALRLRARAPELVAVIRTEGGAASEEELREHARARLPDYMVPRRFVFQDALPRTPAGKLDRRALAARVSALRSGETPVTSKALEGGAGAVEASVGGSAAPSTGVPTTEAEKALAGIWASVLGSDEIFVDDDFFELGGDSLLSIRVIARAKQAGLSIEPQQFFATPTIAALAAAATEGMAKPAPESSAEESDPGSGEGPAVVEALPSRPDDRAPLSFAQEGFWFLDRLDPGNPAYNVAVRIDLDGPLDGERLRRSYRYVLGRHDALRVTVALENGQPVLRALPTERFDLEREDCSGEADPGARLEALSRAMAGYRFDLVGGPLVRGILCRLSPHRHALFLTFHHMVLDGESVRLVLEELGTAYRRMRTDHEEAGEKTGGRRDAASLEPPAVSYLDYAHWEREQWSTGAHAASLEYWTRALADVPERVEWPGDAPGDGDGSPGGATLTRELPRELADAVGEVSRREGCTPFALLLAAYQAFLARHTGQEVVVVGTPVGHRPHPALERAVGYFQNMLPLRGDLTGAPTFSELLARTRRTVAEALAHADAPFERIVEAVTPERDPTTTPLFQTALSFRDGTRSDGWRSALDLSGIDVRAGILHNGAAKFELALEVERTEAGLRLVAEYASDRFRAETVETLLDRFEILLRGALRDPDRAVWNLPAMTPDERRTSLGVWSGSAPDADPPTESPQAGWSDPTVPELVEAVARQDPDRVAVEDESGTLSYGELVAQAGELAARFREAGVGPEDVVAVGLPPSARQIVALLAAWKAGGAFLGLDPTHPPARLRAILEDAEPALVFSDALGDAVPSGVPRLTPRETGSHPGSVPGDSAHPPPGEAVRDGESPEATALAYVIYTSGSTGTPKGVEVEHRALANLAIWHREAFAVEAGDRVAQTANPTFDASVWEVWATLAAGATLVVAPEATRTDPRALVSWMERERITASFLSTPLAEGLLQEGGAPEPLRLLLTGGDRLRSFPPPRWAPPVVNCYGPAECAVVATAGPVPAADTGRLPAIGRPIRHTRLFLLDRNGLPVPPGVAGEICLGGAGLARGYRGLPDETARRFRPAVFPEAAGMRLYHTGDRARFRRDGSLDFLGRLDRQVKIRGQRIELGEVEAALMAAPGVEQAAAEVREAPGGGRQLVAFASAAPGETLAEVALREEVGRRLPGAMVPARVLILETFPLNPSGKVDRQALSRLEIPWEAGDAPEGALEAAIAAVWTEVLGIEEVGRHDDFFAVGGHSLNAISVVSRLEEVFATELPLAAFFDAPTVAGLAKVLGAASRDIARGSGGPSAPEPGLSPGTDATDVDPRSPLSPDQARLWYLHQLDPGSPAYNIPLVYRLRGKLDLAALQGAIDHLVREHDVLRSTVDASGAEPVQRVHGPAPVHIERTILPESTPEAVLERTVRDETRTPFDLARGPLMRARLIQRGPEEHHLILTLHHIVADGWSAGILTRDLSAGYASELQGSSPPAGEAPALRYASWCSEQRAWLESPASSGEVAFWADRLRDTPQLEIPADHRRPDRPSYRGRTHAFRLTREASDRLEGRCRTAGITPFVALLGGFQAFLYRYAGQTDVPVGTVVAGRSSVGSEGVVGLFANTVVVRTEVEPALGVDDLLQRVRAATVDALSRQRLPFARVVEAVQPPRDPSRNPLFQVAFILQNQGAATLDLPGLEVETVPVDTGTAKFDLTFTAQRDDDGFALYLEYATDLFEDETVRRMSGHLETLLEAVAEGFDGPVAELPLVRDREEWSLAGPTSEPRGEPLHDRIREQARRTPDARAVTAEDGGTMLYRELDDRSARIGRALAARGIGVGDVVGVGLPRTPDMVAALLGILRAGAAYLPLDPDFPAPRLAHILDDAGASVLLTTDELQDRFPAGPDPVLLSAVLEESGPHPDSDAGGARGASPFPAVGPEELAYLIYTSGSTGGPKGVEVTHRNVVNLLDSMAARPGLDGATRLLAVTTLSFDISVLEIFGPLLVGGEVVLASTETAGDGHALAGLVDRTDPTHMQGTPSTWRMLLDAGWRGEGGLRALVGGEALPLELARDLSGACREVWNMYGPTETTVWSTCGRVDGSPGPIRVGTPIANTTVYVLDAARQPTPRGVPGELYIAGAGVARGYRNRPELTADRFLPDPFNPGDPGSGTDSPRSPAAESSGGRDTPIDHRMYRTGDRVRLLSDGALEVLGRLDGQVKIHGYRIETAEVEGALEGHPAVRAAVVRAFGTGTPDARLVAFVVPDPDVPVTGSEVRRFARKQLPRYMVPNMISLLDTLPLTPNGKVDRRALADPLEAGRPDTARYEPPASEAERIIAQVWSDLLPGVRVGREDNFFELGGHSLLSIRAVAEIRRRTGRELDPRAFFFQSVEQLAIGLEDDGDSR